LTTMATTCGNCMRTRHQMTDDNLPCRAPGHCGLASWWGCTRGMIFLA
jgi:hypothetical protein